MGETRVIRRRGEGWDQQLVDHRLYSVAQAARQLGVSAESAYRMIRDGRLDTADWGGKAVRIYGLQIRRCAEAGSRPREADQ